MGFNKAQQQAISHKDGPAIVLAGPGSGKTTVITYRVRTLMETYGISGSNILVITFTRAAAAEMRSRFLQLSGNRPGGVTFGTFHSVFFRILKYSYNYDASNILTEKEQRDILSNIISRAKIDANDEQDMLSGILAEISSIKSNDLSLDHYYSRNCPEETFRWIFNEYARQLSA